MHRALAVTRKMIQEARSEVAPAIILRASGLKLTDTDNRAAELAADIAHVIRSFPIPVQELTAALAPKLLELQPELEGKVRLGWGSVNYRHPEAGFVCALLPMEDHVSVVFEKGRLLNSPLLEGDGEQARFIKLVPGTPIPEPELAALLKQAIALRP
jgi:hypothetical protein